MTESKINRLAIFWYFMQILFAFIYIVFMPTFAILTIFIFWQAMTEVGYFIALKVGYHPAPESRTIPNGKGLPFPNFIKNTEAYQKERTNLTVYEEFIRILFSLSCALLLSLYFFTGLAFMKDTFTWNKSIFLVIWMLFFVCSLLIWKLYQKIFAHILGLKIVWKENNRPIFAKKTNKK